MKFADLIASLSVVRDERASVERRLEAARQELAQVKNAPLCKADAIAELDAYVDSCFALFREQLHHEVTKHNVAGFGLERSFGSIGGGFPLVRGNHGQHDDRLVIAILAPQLKSQIREAMKDFACPGSAPVAKRRARRAELEKEIATLQQQLAEIEAAADAARNAL